MALQDGVSRLEGLMLYHIILDILYVVILNIPGNIVKGENENFRKLSVQNVKILMHKCIQRCSSYYRSVVSILEAHNILRVLIWLCRILPEIIVAWFKCSI